MSAGQRVEGVGGPGRRVLSERSISPIAPCPLHSPIPHIRVYTSLQARDWGFTGLTFVPLNNSDPSRQHMRWEVISKQDQYQQLSR